MEFSKVECVIKPFKLDAVKEALIGFGVSGLTVCEVFGWARAAGPAPAGGAAAGDRGLAPKIKLEMLLVSDQVSELVEAIAEAARTGGRGDGRIYVSRVEAITRIRTGERGIDAL